MKITKSELKEMIREALREELREGIFSTKLPEGTVVDFSYDTFNKVLDVFVVPSKGLHKNADKPLRFHIYDLPHALVQEMKAGGQYNREAAQKVYDSELRPGNYKVEKEDYYEAGGWLGNKYGKSPF